MSSMTSADPTANSAFVMAPYNRYPAIPGAMPQVPQYPSNQPQVHLSPGNPPGMEPSVCVQPAQRGLQEGKVLGAVQILIGLIHIGLGSIMWTIISEFYYTSISLYGFFPFWGGFWFILAGSLSISAEKQPRSTCLLSGSLGLNIISAIFSVTGIALFIADLCINSRYIHPEHHSYQDILPGNAVSGTLLIFCLLEFCIACTSAHFGCELVCYSNNNVAILYPNVSVANSMNQPTHQNQPRTSQLITTNDSSEVQAPYKQSQKF